MRKICETSTSGGTSSSNIASSPGGLGSGFDPNGDWGVYNFAKKKYKNNNKIVIKRLNENINSHKFRFIQYSDNKWIINIDYIDNTQCIVDFILEYIPEILEIVTYSNIDLSMLSDINYNIDIQYGVNKIKYKLSHNDEYMPEILDNPSIVEWSRKSNRGWYGSFSINEVPYEIKIEPIISDTWHVVFSLENDYSKKNNLNRTGKTNQMKDKSIKVFSTVINSLLSFLSTQKPKKLIFRSDNDSHVKLYRSIISKYDSVIDELNYSTTIENNVFIFDIKNDIENQKINQKNKKIINKYNK